VNTSVFYMQTLIFLVMYNMFFITSQCILYNNFEYHYNNGNRFIGHNNILHIITLLVNTKTIDDWCNDPE